MSIQVIIKRKWKVNKPKELFPLFKELHSVAEEQPGYISSETLRSLEKPDNLVVISKWETVEDWEKWTTTKERRDIQGKVDSLIGEKTFYEVFENIMI
jgi:heme-degrading monooxygenase HmoA